MIRVLIGDASPLFRRGIAAVIQEEDDLELVGGTEGGKDLIPTAVQLDPDVIIYGMSALGTRGPDIIRTLHLQLPNAGVILFSDEDDEQLLFDAVKAGASAYLLKSASADEFAST